MSDDPCSWPVDERVNIVQSRPQDFLASLQIHAWLQASPTFEDLSSSYGLDLIGLSPDLLPGGSKSVLAHQVDGTASPFKLLDEHFHLSLVELQSWEHLVFPEMVRFPTLYLAVRNLILCLWYRNPKRLLTSQLVYNFCFVRGLLRIVLCESWIPRLLKELTYRGLINFGTTLVTTCPSGGEGVLVNGNGSSEAGSDGPVTEPDALRIRLFGRLEPSTAVATRQLINGLLLERHATGSECPTRPAEVRFQSLRPPGNQASNHWLSFFDEVCLDLPTACCPDDTMMDEKHELVTAEDTGKKELKAVKMPQNIWANRFYTHTSHPLEIMAWQTGLPLTRLGDCCLLWPQHSSTAAGEKGGTRRSTVRVDPKLALRMQFHVEAVLALVAQLNSKDEQDENNDPAEAAVEAGAPPQTLPVAELSVQSIWDRLDMETRKRLDDLTNSEEEKRLVEFYMASVEYDITEPLIASPVSWHRPSHEGHVTRRDVGESTAVPRFPSARLDLLPTRLYETGQSDDQLRFQEKHHSTDTESSHDDTAAASWSACLLGGFSSSSFSSSVDDHQLANWSSLCSRLLSASGGDGPVTAASPSPVTHIVVGDKEAVVDPASTSSVAVDSPSADKPSEFASPALREKNIRVYFADGTSEAIDWAIFPPSVNPDLLIDMSTDSTRWPPPPPLQSAPSQTVTVHLPKHLLPLLVDQLASSEDQEEEVEHPAPGDTPVTREKSPGGVPPLARLINVTLVYPTAWWRSPLRRIAHPNGSEDGGASDRLSGLVTQFALLPASREERGFCHVFCDLFPDFASASARFLIGLLVNLAAHPPACFHQLDSPGIIRTQLFAVAADHWWSVSDSLLCAAIDRHLRRHLSPAATTGTDSPLPGNGDGEPEACSPIHSHVDRRQHGDYADASTSLPVRLDTGKQQSVSATAFASSSEELARRTGLLFMSNQSACCQPYISCPTSMDALTASLSRGFQLAHRIRQLLPALDQTNGCSPPATTVACLDSGRTVDLQSEGLE